MGGGGVETVVRNTDGGRIPVRRGGFGGGTEGDQWGGRGHQNTDKEGLEILGPEKEVGGETRDGRTGGSWVVKPDRGVDPYWGVDLDRGVNSAEGVELDRRVDFAR